MPSAESAKSIQSSGAEPIPPPLNLRYGAVLKSVLIYGGGVVAGKLASLILVPLYTRWLTQAEYGTLELLDVTQQAATKLLWSGFPYAVWYFYAQAEVGKPRNKVVSTGLWAALAVGGLGALAGSLLAPGISRALWGTEQKAVLLCIVFAGLMVAFPLEVAASWFRILDQPVRYVSAGMGRLALHTALAVVLLVVFGLGLQGILWSSLLSGAVVTCVVLWYTLRRTGFTLQRGLFLKMARYSGPAILVGSCSFLMHFGDRYFLRQWVSLSELGIYSLAYKFGMLVTLVQYAFQSYWNAQVFNIAARPGASVLLGRALTYLTLALCATAVSITACARPVIALLAPRSYAPAAALAPLVSIGYVLFALASFYQTLFYVKNRTGSDAVMSLLGAALAGLGYVVLIPRYRLWGAALATVFSFACSLAVGCVWSRRFAALQYERARLLKVVVPAAILTGLYAVMPRPGLPGDVAIGAAMIVLFAASLFGTGFFDPGEKEFARRCLTRVRSLCNAGW